MMLKQYTAITVSTFLAIHGYYALPQLKFYRQAH